MKRTLFYTLLIAAILPLSSFKKNDTKRDTLYCFLEYEVLSKDNTWIMIVSDVMTYDDWKENSIEIRKKFAATAINETNVEVWEPSIKDKGVADNRDDVLIARAKELKNFKNYHDHNKTYTIRLSR